MLKRLLLIALCLFCLSPVSAGKRDTDVQIPISNNSFEIDADLNQVPDDWTPYGFTFLDGRDCSTSVNGMCSLYLVHHDPFNPNRAGKSLSILVDADVPAGVLFHAQTFAKVENLQVNSAQFIVSLLDDGVVSQSFTVTLASGTYNWTVFGDLFTTTAATDQMSVKLVYRSLTGHVYLDYVSAGYLTSE